MNEIYEYFDIQLFCINLYNGYYYYTLEYNSTAVSSLEKFMIYWRTPVIPIKMLRKI